MVMLVWLRIIDKKNMKRCKYWWQGRAERKRDREMQVGVHKSSVAYEQLETLSDFLKTEFAAASW